MDSKITLRFDKDVISKAKHYAEKNSISLSRLVESLLQKITSANYQSFEEFPIADWVRQVAEGATVYQTGKRTRKHSKEEYFSSKRVD